MVFRRLQISRILFSQFAHINLNLCTRTNSSLWHFAILKPSCGLCPSSTELDESWALSSLGPGPSVMTFVFQSCIRPVHHGAFSYLHATCVGQAKNPGPSERNIRFAVTNPTAVYGKLPELRSFDADVIFASETSAILLLFKDIAPEK